MSYTHRDKTCTPGAAAIVGGVAFKWYEVAFPETPVPESISDMARAFVAPLDVPGDGGFAILHRCGDNNFYFLMLQTWRNDNEMWESVYAKAHADPGFALFPRPAPHLPNFCVWELGAVWHERNAWRRYLLSARDDAARAAWAADLYRGQV